MFEDVCWSAELADFARSAIRDFTGLPAEGRRPLRAGDISFQNLGVPTFFMLSSTMPAELRRERGLYAVGGCGGNVEWHTEADTLEIADRERLLRDAALDAPLLPDFAAAARAGGTVPTGVVQTELRRARNRLEGALRRAAEHARF